jgi:hypothetical protein
MLSIIIICILVFVIGVCLIVGGYKISYQIFGLILVLFPIGFGLITHIEEKSNQETIPTNAQTQVLVSETFLSDSATDAISHKKYGNLVLANSVYEGYILNGEPSGEGTIIFDNGDKYTGNWVNGDRTGQGTFYWANGDNYTGNFVNDKRDGKGTYKWASGGGYTGDWVDGERTGQGTEYLADGCYYTGSFVNGGWTGYGTLTLNTGETLTGNWKNGDFIG